MRCPLAFALLLSLAACTSAPPGPETPADAGGNAGDSALSTDAPGARVCVPGSQVGCTCIGGATGAQVCNAEGTALGSCMCPDAGAPTDASTGTDAPAADAGADGGGRLDASCEASCGDGSVCAGGACVSCDGDRDGVPSTACGGADCDDSEPLTRPGAPEVCDGRDNDCNGRDDELTIAFTATDECNRRLDTAYPGIRGSNGVTCVTTPAAGRPAGVERYSLVCRLTLVQSAMRRCYCVALNGARWECPCD